MRVLHVLEAMGGGTKKYVELLVTGLRARDVDVTLALPLERPFDLKSALMDYNFPAQMRERGFRVEQFGMLHGRIRLRDDLPALLALYRFMRRERFDVVHTHSAKAGALGRAAAFCARVPRVVHTPYSLPFRREVDQGLTYFSYFLVEWLLARVTDTMIATSPSEWDEIKRSGLVRASALALVPNGLDVENYEFSFNHRETNKEAVGWSPRSFVAGTVARLSPQKGVHVLMAAVPQIREKVRNARVIIVGAGELESDLLRQCNDLRVTESVDMLGARSDYVSLMKAFDVFVLPSFWEGLPYAPLEAMALGTPVVGSDVVGVRDIVQNEKTGLLVPPGDPEGLAQAICRLQNDRDLAWSLAVNARRFVEENFGTDIQVEATIDVYEGSPNSGRGGDIAAAGTPS